MNRNEIETCPHCEEPLFHCEPCAEWSCQTCEETKCTTCWETRRRVSGCLNCFARCGNCSEDVCGECAVYCTVGIACDPSCSSCSRTLDACVLCDSALNNAVHACWECAPHIYRDDGDVCEDCALFDATVCESERPGYDGVSLPDAADVVTLKACVRVWKWVADAASYAPGGRGYKRTREEFEGLCRRGPGIGRA